MGKTVDDIKREIEKVKENMDFLQGQLDEELKKSKWGKLTLNMCSISHSLKEDHKLLIHLNKSLKEKKILNEDRFYMVLVHGTTYTQQRHYEYAAAKQEAERLLKKFPEDKVHILACYETLSYPEKPVKVAKHF